jgi:hypothetical protein
LTLVVRSVSQRIGLFTIDLGVKREFWRWWRKERVSDVIIADSRVVMDMIDEVDCCDPVTPVRRRNHDVAIAVEAAADAKLALPLMRERTQANEAVAHHFIRTYLRARDVRITHMARILPIAVALVFIPNESEIFARKLMATPLFVERVEEQSREYYSREAPWLGNWFGRKVKPKPIPRA